MDDQIRAEHVHDILVRAVGEEDFEPERSAVQAMFRCLFPQTPYRHMSAGDVSQEQRLALEQHIHQLVFALGCEAEASNLRVLDYVHPHSHPHAVLPRLLDMVLSLGDAHYLEPGFIFTLLERLVEMTMLPEECHALIDWILRNKATLKHDHIFVRGKLILLRTVNRMLKMLQKGEDPAYHAGRLLFFMSELYPMAERSATNHSGLRDMAHPVKMHNWNEPLLDDFGRSVEKADYDLYWRTLDRVQKTVTSETDVMRALDLVQRLLDLFKSHPCRREGSPYLSRGAITLVNDTTPEHFMDILRDPDCRMECIVQIYVFVQKHLASSRNPVVTSEGGKGRLSSTQSDIEHYIKSDHDLKQRWGPIYETLLQEPKWIEWKNEGASEWVLPPVTEHPWMESFCKERDEVDISQIHDCLKEKGGRDQAMDNISPDASSAEMQTLEGMHIDFDRDLEEPDFTELHVPTAKEFLDSALGDEEIDEASLELYESNTSFCWRTYRLLSEQDIQHMVNAEHRTNFGKLLQSTQLQNEIH